MTSSPSTQSPGAGQEREPDERAKDAVARLGQLLDEIDEQTQQPGEPYLRSVFAQHAREQSAALRRERDHDV